MCEGCVASESPAESCGGARILRAEECCDRHLAR